MKYIFADTNIFIYCALITKGNYTTQTIDNLYKIINREDVKLLMPEVVKLEFNNKAKSIFKNDVTNNINRVKQEIKNISFPDYLGEEKSEIEKNIENLLKEREQNLERVSNKILANILENQNTIWLNLNNDIFLNAYKRALSGRKPHKGSYNSSSGDIEQSINADCIIIESLIDYFKNKETEEDELLFCSNNTKDFALFSKENNIHEIHPEIKEDLKIKVKYYNNLPDLLKYEFKSNINKNETQKIKAMDTESKIIDILYKLGVPLQVKGYQYLKQAILMVVENVEIINNARDMLYLAIAEKYDTTTIKVRVAIMHAIETAWNGKRKDIHEKIFGSVFSKARGRPTILEFIALVSDYIRLDMQI